MRRARVSSPFLFRYFILNYVYISVIHYLKRLGGSMDEIMIHPHALVHGLSEDDVIDAWMSGGPRMPRSSPNEDEVVVVGWTRDERVVQMVGVIKEFGTLVIHALEPPTDNVLKELGIGRKKGNRR